MKIETGLNVPVDYYPFEIAQRQSTALRIGDINLTESYRLEQDEQKLLGFYPHAANILAFDDVRLPYALLTPADIAITIGNQPYQAPEAIRAIHDQIERALRALYASKGYSAGILTRMQQLDSDTAVVQPVSYTDVMATNLIADVPISNFAVGSANKSDSAASPLSLLVGERGRGLGGILTLRTLDMSQSNANDELPPLEKSLMANPIGVAGIGISSDNKLLIMHRAAHLSTYADVLGGSASGYVDWQDTVGATSLDGLLLNALKREIVEELSLQSDETGDFQLLGVYREFYRAGFVQAFYRFRVDIRAALLAERMSSHPHGEYQAMLAIDMTSGTQAVIKSIIQAGQINAWIVGKELRGLLATL